MTTTQNNLDMKELEFARPELLTFLPEVQSALTKISSAPTELLSALTVVQSALMEIQSVPTKLPSDPTELLSALTLVQSALMEIQSSLPKITSSLKKFSSDNSFRSAVPTKFGITSKLMIIELEDFPLKRRDYLLALTKISLNVINPLLESINNNK